MADAARSAQTVVSTSELASEVLSNPWSRWFICAETAADRAMAEAFVNSLQLLVAVDALVVESRNIESLLLSNPGPACIVSTCPNPRVAQLPEFEFYWSISCEDLALWLQFADYLAK